MGKGVLPKPQGTSRRVENLLIFNPLQIERVVDASDETTTVPLNARNMAVRTIQLLLIRM